MKPIEYVKLLEKIQKDHTMSNLTKNRMRKIKYVTCNYDTRDNQIYRVSLREWFDNKPIEFPREHIIGVKLRVEELYEDIVKWLEETKNE